MQFVFQRKGAFVKKTTAWLCLLSTKAVFLMALGICFAIPTAYANGFLITGGREGGTNDEDLCLDVRYGQFSNGSVVQSYTCNSTNAQKWIINGAPGGFNGFSLSPAAAPNYCLDVPGWNFTTGQYLQIWTCNGGTNQKFYLPEGGTAIVANDGSGYNHYCLSIQSSDIGTPITLAQCNGSMSQQFLPYGFKLQIYALPLRGFHTQCLTVNGSSVQTTNCGLTSNGYPNPLPAQVFSFDFNNHLVNAGTGLCLDQGNFTGGLYLRTCDSGAFDSQSFFPGAVSPALSGGYGLLGYGARCININGNYWQPSYVNTVSCNANSLSQAWAIPIVSN
jgi:hypothetical protein